MKLFRSIDMVKNKMDYQFDALFQLKKTLQRNDKSVEPSKFNQI